MKKWTLEPKVGKAYQHYGQGFKSLFSSPDPKVQDDTLYLLRIGSHAQLFE